MPEQQESKAPDQVVESQEDHMSSSKILIDGEGFDKIKAARDHMNDLKKHYEEMVKKEMEAAHAQLWNVINEVTAGAVRKEDGWALHSNHQDLGFFVLEPRPHTNPPQPTGLPPQIAQMMTQHLNAA
ncbi:MAG: hypothetical protein KDA17_07410 [Candidatus Saccharibacteria bacterium]|nr:hypothetical protein [Candidatus Saccharibacteria bacterium]